MSRYRFHVMTRLQIVFLVVVLPLCLGQFSIKGPSDGSRQAQGLKYSRDKGIEYEDQRASLGSGDFSIQGASDGNSNFNIQGASDGNSDFQIQGATDGNANFQIQGATDGNANFQIQGATDSNANFRIQGPTEGNVNYQLQGASAGHQQQQSVIQRPAYDGNRNGGRALQYRDPSGLSVNWKSYQQAAPQHPQQSIQQQQQQQEQQQPTHNTFIPHDAILPQSVPRRHRPVNRQQQPHRQQQIQQQQQPLEPEEQPVAPTNYKSYDNAPPQIKQLLQFQKQIPYLNIIPQQYRYDAINGQEQNQEIAEPETKQELQQRPINRGQYRGKQRGQPRNKRQTHRQNQQPVESQPQYSTNVPSGIQNILKFQSQIPYINHIPEKWRYDTLAAGQTFKQEFRTQQQNYVPPSQDQGQHRQRREAQQQSQIRQYRQHHQQQQQPARQQQQQQQPQYQRIAQPAVEPQPHYSTNVPSGIQNILKFQSQAPYVNHIPEKWRYDALAAGQNFRQEFIQQQSYNQQQQNKQQQQRQPQDQGQHRQKRQTQQSQIRQYRQQQQQHRQQQQQQQQQPQYQRISQPPVEPQPHYSANLPAQLQNLLKFQAQTPYTSVIPEKFRYENLAAAQGQHRQKRQTTQHQQQQQQVDLQQYKRISQPPVDPQPHYSTNIPQSIQKLLTFQSQTPNNIIANQIIYRPDKPYVPQPIQQQPQRQQQQPQYQQQQPQYQQQQPQYQQQQPQYQQQQPQYRQPQPQYQQQQPQPQQQLAYQGRSGYQGQGQSPQGVRPVTERQY